jgi:cyclin D1/2/4, plant
LDPVDQVGDARYVFEAKTIQRMELLVLSTLKWRMQAVTPFSYIDYFLHRFNGGGDATPSRRSVVRSAELILRIASGEQPARMFQS